MTTLFVSIGGTKGLLNSTFIIISIHKRKKMFTFQKIIEKYCFVMQKYHIYMLDIHLFEFDFCACLS